MGRKVSCFSFLILLLCSTALAAQRTDRLDLTGGSTAPGELRIYEDTDNGANYIAQTVGALSDTVSFSWGSFNTDLMGTSFADDQIFVADNASGGTVRTITNCTDSGGNHLNYDQSTNSFSCGTSSSGAGGWTDGTNEVNPTVSADNVGIGGTSLAKLSVDGDTDETQLLIQGNATQTSNLVVFEKSDGTDLFTWANDGTYTQSGSATPSMSLGGGTPATYPITFSLSGSSDPVLTAVDTGWKWAAASEDLTTAFTSNTATVSTSTGVTNVTYSSIDLIVPTEVYDAGNWNADNSVPTKDAVRDKIESLSAGSLPAVDTTSIVEGSGDATKEIRFEVDGITTGTVRVITPPNEDFTMAGVATTQTLTNKTLTTPVVDGTPASAGAIGYNTTQKMVTSYGGATAVEGAVSRTLAVGIGTESKTNSATSDQDFSSMYTFPASSIFTNKVYRVSIMTELTTGVSTANITHYLKMGSTKVYSTGGAGDVSNSFVRNQVEVFYIIGRAAAGAAAAVSVAPVNASLGTNLSNGATIPINLATNGTLTISAGVSWDATGSTETLEQQGFIIEELN